MATKSLKKRVIIPLGPPGSGKGTQGVLLAESLGLHYLETSKILEKGMADCRKGDKVKVEDKDYILAEERETWETGGLVSSPLVTFWIAKEIEKLAEKGEGLVLSGSPRTLYEGERIIPLLKRLYGIKNIQVVVVKLSAEDSIWRNSHRRICALMRHPILYTKETAKLKYCPFDGSKLLKRKGLDDPKTIRVRLKEYENKILPLIKLFQKQGLKINRISGGQTVEKVFKDILKAIK